MSPEFIQRNKYIQFLGGRKFLATISCGMATSFLAWHDKIDSSTYAMVIIGTVGTFIGGNVYSKLQSRSE